MWFDVVVYSPCSFEVYGINDGNMASMGCWWYYAYTSSDCVSVVVTCGSMWNRLVGDNGYRKVVWKIR